MPTLGPMRDVVTACQLLFGPDVDVTRNFLEILEPAGAKAAFRRRARETHPDLHPTDPEVQQRQALLFQELTSAYTRVTRFCERRPVTHSQVHLTAPRTAAPKKATANPRPRGAARPGHYFMGEIPRRSMVIGRYLYYRRIIPYHVLIEALTWQRRQRPAVGQIAQSWGWLDAEDVAHILTTADVAGRFGERAQALELLSAGQVKVLLHHQRTRQRQIGEYFVGQGYLTLWRLALILSEMHRHNAGYPPVGCKH